ncbi:hypothetical protein F503_01654 [Ophiostoma piceae UAMH 11346]|uniref:Uncharacterized protein n=1 Tax=Ophiostoma piceae (strain UAMH 11346) TaxID=1262450 RepID=S3BS82_OPHP1|nr:hypothetical protein F503_01654 [Ophiostoma piceae UAMH 11346]
MDSLKSLTTYVPNWIDRLDELSGKIEQRQTELARLEADTKDTKDTDPRPTRAKSLRNKGSTESLRPTDEPARDATPEPEPAMPQLTAAMRRTLRSKKRRTESLVSLDDGDHENSKRNQNRTRSMIIVYYDSYVQTFFEDLVKFVSAQRNMMRKAKMAAKVAHIKRMAELEMPDDGEEDAGVDELAPDVDFSKRFTPQPKADTFATDAIAVDTRIEARIEVDTRPGAVTGAIIEIDDKIEVGGGKAATPLNYRSTAMLAGGRPTFMRASGRQSYMPPSMSKGFTGSYLQKVKPPPDIYDELDKNLEYVQSTSEHAAHQFLRDGDCNDEIDNVKQRLVDIHKQAAREMERVKTDDPEALKEEPVKSRSFRPQTMRKPEPKPKAKDAKDTKISAPALIVRPDNTLEVDEDEGIEVDAVPEPIKV